MPSIPQAEAHCVVDFSPVSNASSTSFALARALSVVAWGAFLLLAAITMGVLLGAPRPGMAEISLAPAAFLAAFFLVLLAALARLSALAARRWSPGTVDRAWLFWPLAFPGLLLAIAVPYLLVQNGSWATALLAIALVVGEQLATSAVWRRVEGTPAANFPDAPAHVEATIVAKELLGEQAVEDETIDSEANEGDLSEQAEFASNATQQIHRWREESTGAEQLHAVLRGEARPGDTVVYFHLAICPAFVSMPSAQCELIEGPPAEAEVAFAAEYGVRCEARLSEPVFEATTMVVEIYVQEAPT